MPDETRDNVVIFNKQDPGAPPPHGEPAPRNQMQMRPEEALRQMLDEITAALSPAPDDAGPYSASDVSVNSLSSAPDRVAAGSRSLNVADSRERPAPIAALKPADAIPVWDAVQMAEAGALRIGWWNYMRARGVSQDDAIAKINAALQSKERKA